MSMWNEPMCLSLFPIKCQQWGGLEDSLFWVYFNEVKDRLLIFYTACAMMCKGCEIYISGVASQTQNHNHN